MDYEQEYNKLVNAIKMLQETNPSDEGIQNWVNDNVPELAESKDEKKELKKVEQKPDNEVKPFDELARLTDFERTLADICIGWIGKEMGWEQYIKDNADVLLRIAIEKFNSVQDVPFEQKLSWSEEDEVRLQSCLSILKAKSLMGKIDTANTMWLKSLKQRIGG